MESSMVSVKEYHLAAEDIRIVFRDGDEQSTSLEHNGNLFSGDALHRERTAGLGLVVSVELEAVPDLRVTFLSLVVPEANRASAEKSIAVGTFAVYTTVRTSIAGPAQVHGQLRTSRVLRLSGNAW